MPLSIEMINPHWLGSAENQQNDLCLHANVFFKINDDILNSGTEHVWCVSAGALRLMRSIIQNHYIGGEQHILPCCGHTMIAKSGGTEVDIYGCTNGMDFTILHRGTQMELISDNEISRFVLFNDFKESIMNFVKEIEIFYQQSEARTPIDEFEKTRYQAFWKEWDTLKDKIYDFDPLTYCPLKIDFSDYISITSDSVIDIHRNGINYKGLNGAVFINFSECGFNYQTLNGGSEKIAGEIDKTGSVPSFAFYTAPLTTHIFFVQKNRIFDLFHSSKLKFEDMENKINTFGYSFSSVI